MEKKVIDFTGPLYQTDIPKSQSLFNFLVSFLFERRQILYIYMFHLTPRGIRSHADSIVSQSAYYIKIFLTYTQHSYREFFVDKDLQHIRLSGSGFLSEEVLHKYTYSIFYQEWFFGAYLGSNIQYQLFCLFYKIILRNAEAILYPFIKPSSRVLNFLFPMKKVQVLMNDLKGQCT